MCNVDHLVIDSMSATSFGLQGFFLSSPVPSLRIVTCPLHTGDVPSSQPRVFVMPLLECNPDAVLTSQPSLQMPEHNLEALLSGGIQSLLQSVCGAGNKSPKSQRERLELVEISASKENLLDDADWPCEHELCQYERLLDVSLSELEFVDVSEGEMPVPSFSNRLNGKDFVEQAPASHPEEMVVAAINSSCASDEFIMFVDKDEYQLLEIVLGYELLHLDGEWPEVPLKGTTRGAGSLMGWPLIDTSFELEAGEVSMLADVDLGIHLADISTWGPDMTDMVKVPGGVDGEASVQESATTTNGENPAIFNVLGNNECPRSGKEEPGSDSPQICLDSDVQLSFILEVGEQSMIVGVDLSFELGNVSEWDDGEVVGEGGIGASKTGATACEETSIILNVLEDNHLADIDMDHELRNVYGEWPESRAEETGQKSSKESRVCSILEAELSLKLELGQQSMIVSLDLSSELADVSEWNEDELIDWEVGTTEDVDVWSEPDLVDDWEEGVFDTKLTLERILQTRPLDRISIKTVLNQFENEEPGCMRLDASIHLPNVDQFSRILDLGLEELLDMSVEEGEGWW